MAKLKPHEECALIGQFDPVSQGAGTVLTDWADMRKFSRALIILQVGTMAASATLDAVVKQATDGSGTGSKNLASSKAITQLTQAGTDSNKQVLISVDVSEMDLTGKFYWLALSMTAAVAASLISCTILGFGPHNYPAFDNDIASVDEIIA
jgi:hypothetical protein